MILKTNTGSQIKKAVKKCSQQGHMDTEGMDSQKKSCGWQRSVEISSKKTT